MARPSIVRVGHIGIQGPTGDQGTRGVRGYAGEAGYSIPEPERTFHVVGDLHFGFARTDNDARMDVMAADLATLGGLHLHRLYVGDLVETPGSGASGTTPGANDTAFLTWAAALDPDRGTWDAAVGNHDLSGGRLADDWATIYGYADQNWTQDFGFCRVVCVGADEITTHPDAHQTLSATTLAWLDDQLRLDGRDTIVLSHGPLARTAIGVTNAGFNTFLETYSTQPDADVLAVLDKYPHARAWVAGHSHTAYETLGAITRHWTGSRFIAHINAGAPGWIDATVPSADDPIRSIYVTLLDDRLEVRVRNHSDAAWEPLKRRYAVELPTIDRAPAANPTAFVFPLNETLIGESLTGGMVLSTSGGPPWVTVSGEHGLSMATTTYRAFLEPDGLLLPTQGALVVRCSFATMATSTQAVIYHQDGTGNRLNVQRPNTATVTDKTMQATIGGVYSMGSVDPVPDGEIVTVGLNWQAGEAELYVDGAVVAKETYSGLTEVISTMYFGSRTGGNAVGGAVFGVAGFTRPLTAREHRRFAVTKSDRWSTETVLTEPRPVAATANPTTFALSFDGTLIGETQTGTITATAAVAATYDTATTGQRGLKVLEGSGQKVTLNPTGLLDSTSGAIVVRVAMTDTAAGTTQYVFAHNTPAGTDRLMMQRTVDTGSALYHKLTSSVGTGGANVSPGAYADNAVVTIGLNWDSGTAQLYVNGSLLDTDAYTGLVAIDDELVLGTSVSGTLPIDGLLLGAAGFDRALTALEHARMALPGSWALDTVTGG